MGRSYDKRTPFISAFRARNFSKSALVLLNVGYGKNKKAALLI